MGDDSAKDSPNKLRRMLYRSPFVHRLREHRYFVALVLGGLIVCVYLLYNQLPAADRHHVNPQNVGEGNIFTASEPSKSVGKRKNPRLFYNRVPKCGSSTLVELLKKLATRNGFEHVASPLLDDWAIFIADQQRKFVADFMAMPALSSFDRHLFFLDFTTFNSPNPIYINMIRDPTERFISEFYFRRRRQNEGVKKGERKWYDEDLENCIRTGNDYDCRLVDGTLMKNMIAFFCGHDLECSKHNSKLALERAKTNVIKFYDVVGVLEDLEMTLTVLEKKLPQYFSGAMDIHSSSSEHVVNKGKNKAERVSQEIKDMIRQNLTAEYEFYDFVKARLSTQLHG